MVPPAQLSFVSSGLGCPLDSDFTLTLKEVKWKRGFYQTPIKVIHLEKSFVSVHQALTMVEFISFFGPDGAVVHPTAGASVFFLFVLF